ncbi:MAG: M28 family peptidase [Flavobacteriales bacterium]|nr:M28 family peptidase [Flavobacteriales bacterium]
MKQALSIILLFLTQHAFSQDMDYAHEVLNRLCSDELAGRGYVEDGDNAAAFYIEEEFKANDLYAWNFNYYQQFTMPVNSFPATVALSVDGKPLIVGKDFHVEADAPSVRGKYELTYIDRLPTVAPSGRVIDSTASYKGFVVLEDSLIAALPPSIRMSLLHGFKKAGAKGIIRLSDTKLTWSVSKQQAPIAQFIVSRDKWSNGAKSVEVDVKAEFDKKHRTQNVLAYIEGSEHPDQFIVFTAHYDHLGKMGSDVIFRGANDNASGVTMLLNLAKHYAKPENEPKYSIAFIAFAGEEAGLVGSMNYVQNPIFPLKDIKFLINLDILGTGDEGITVVNGAVHTKEFELLSKINEERGYLTNVKKRGKAAISDHYPFSEAGVPCFYVYTMGGIQAYHDVYDLPETLPLTEFEDLFRLFTDFVATF